VVLVALVLVWAGAFAFGVRAMVRDVRYPSVFVGAPATPDDYPTVTGFRKWAHDPASAIRIGDRLLDVDGHDLRGTGPVAFLAVFAEVSRGRDRVRVDFDRAGERGTTALPAQTLRVLAPLVAASVVFVSVAVLLALRAQFLGTWPETWAAIGLHVVTLTVLGPLWVYALLLFPEGDRARARHVWPWLFAPIGILHTGHVGTPVPPEIGIPGAAALVVALLTTNLTIATRAYQRADPIGRRQLRWFLFGVYCATMPTIVAGALSASDPAFNLWYDASLTAVAALPLALLISIARFNLFDIDRLISTTASYNVLLTLALGIGVTVVPRTAEAAAELLGVQLWVGRVCFSLPIAFLVVAAHRRLRPRIDRLFFPERYAFEAGVRQLLARLSGCQDAKQLTLSTSEALVDLLRPESCVVYARTDDRFVPLYVDGRAAPRAFESDGPLVTTLHVRREPLAFEPYGRRAKIQLSPFERAVLETLDAVVVVPIWRADTLLLVICLGRKRSHDVYTGTDLRLLGMVADNVSTQLERFAQEEVVRQSRAMQEALRRYVPASVAEAIGSGRDLGPVEREITVMFVDLRGYTAFCESRPPAEIFTTVNRYTEAVSAVIRQQGGTIVEFNGDGMMAVLGASGPVRDKETRAVHAARELIAAVAALGPPSPTEGVLAVGVGVATGRAFVGTLRSADRLIWTAVGNPVNLAARLQALTRTFDALVAIDQRTWAAAGEAARQFRRREGVVIRGRRDPEDVYVLPIAAHAAA
jgi:class 3 adenylate cyclase